MYLFRKLLISSIFVGFVFNLSCININSSQQEVEEKEPNFDSELSATEISFSKGFSINYHEYYKLINVKNPWQNSSDISYKYLLVNRGNEIPLVEADAIISIPAKRIICLSTTHIGFLEKINELQAIMGISGSRLVYNSTLINRIESNDLPDVGYDSGLNYELIISLKPDVVFAYSIEGGELAWINKLQELGIPVVLVGEYLENNPLARAEWLLFFSAFFNKENEAQNLFKDLSLQYNRLKATCDSLAGKPSLITGLPWKGNWYIPEGESYQAVLFRDAGANYIWKNIEGRESFVVDIEKVVKEGKESDFWINPGQVKSISEMIFLDNRLENFSSIEAKNVFNTTKRLSKKGGMDYWESGAVNPHIVLKDLIHIFHPEFFSKHELYYYQRLN